MKVRIEENSRISELDFETLEEFSDWLKDQGFEPGEKIIFLTQAY